MKIKPSFMRLFHFHLCHHNIRWKRVVLMYFIFIPLMLLLESCLHHLPLELYDFRNVSFEDIDLTDIFYTTEQFY